MKLALINVPPFLPKKPGNDLYYLQASQNLGMIATASAAAESGHDVMFFDWLGPQQGDFEKLILPILSNFSPHVVGFSVPSGYAEPYLSVLPPLIKQMSSDIVTIVGGQYHVGFRVTETLRNYPSIDAVAIGSGEAVDWGRLIHGESDEAGGVVRRSSQSDATRALIHEGPTMHWELSGLPLGQYAPSIELSRGCPFKCSFCSLSGSPERLHRQSIDRIQRQVGFWVSYWGFSTAVPIYCECPVFFANTSNIGDLELCFAPFIGAVEWRTQARVDSVTPDMFQRLYRLGLRIIDLGLESASPRMLLEMGKTREPGSYLTRARNFIRTASDAGIKVKLNLLLYPGETRDTAAETYDFVLKHRSYIAGVAAGSAIEFPGTTLSRDFESLFKRFGTSRVRDPNLEQAGIFPLHLSKDFSFVEAREWCLGISREVMSCSAYYDLKRVGYYAPTVTFAEFLTAAQQVDQSLLPFSTAGGPLPTNVSGAVEWDTLR